MYNTFVYTAKNNILLTVICNMDVCIAAYDSVR